MNITTDLAPAQRPNAAANAERAVTKIYNSALAAAAIPTAWEVGLLDAIRAEGEVYVPAFAAAHNLDSDSMEGLSITLQIADVLVYDAGNVRAGTLFEEVYRTKSFFHWLTLGSGGLFSRMQYVVRNEHHNGGDPYRDPAAIAYGCRELSREFFDPAFWSVMQGLSVKFHQVVDLGAGSGERLMQILERYPGTTGLGIDVAGPAVEFAQAEVERRGFGKRISLMQGDARDLHYRDEFANVDLLTCFMMGHDFWPRENCVVTLRKLRAAFPNVRRFVLGDATRSLLPSAGSQPRIQHANENNVPLFNLGLELGHVLMDVYIPTLDEWYDVFAEGGWRCIKGHEIKEPRFAVVFELEPLDERSSRDSRL